MQGSGVPSRARHGEDALKRGSDSLLEAKLKDQLAKPRSLQNRAQSLDLTYSLTRINETPRSGLSRPDSPETSPSISASASASGAGTNTGGTSSPVAATAPSFPSVYGPPGAQRGAGVVSGNVVHGMGRPVALDEESVEEVARVISNLGL